jgi:hypothetical protein
MARGSGAVVTLVVFALLLLPVEGVTRKKRKAAAESVTQGKRVHADVTELQTDVTNLPERCTVKTKNGDTVEMHYRVRLLPDIPYPSGFHSATVPFHPSHLFRLIPVRRRRPSQTKLLRCVVAAAGVPH